MKSLDEVAEKVNRPFLVKLAESREIIAHHFEEFGDKVGVAFSGGKDSQVVLYLARQMKTDVPVIFNNTGVEYPETVRFIQEISALWQLNITITRPEKGFWQCVEEYGFPQQSKRRGNNNHCCYWLKKKPMRIFLREKSWLGYMGGITAAESWGRMFNARDKGACFHDRKWGVCKTYPILWWTEAEVFAFIEQERLPLNPLYAKGLNRIGCMPCTAYRDWERKMLITQPKLYWLIKLRKDRQYAMELDGGK